MDDRGLIQVDVLQLQPITVLEQLIDRIVHEQDAGLLPYGVHVLAYFSCGIIDIARQ
jgi:hypothetical protein